MSSGKPYECRLRPHLRIAEKRTSGQFGPETAHRAGKVAAKNLLAATGVVEAESLWKNRCRNDAEISQAEFGAKRAIVREEIEKANESLGLKLPSEKHLVRLAHETPGKTPLPKGGAMLTTGEEMQVKRFVVE